MKKLLRLEIKQNLRRPPRVYVKSTDLKITYGSFPVDNPDSFDGWDELSTGQTVELKQFIQNVEAVYRYLSPSPANSLTDFRFRLPYEFIELLEQVELLCHEDNVEIDIFDSMISGIIQQMKIAVTKLSDSNKKQALTLLDKANLAEYKKVDFNNQIKSVFSELQAVFDRSEKLHTKALNLFAKDKSYSPLAIKGMAEGETTPSKWLISCAIDVLIDERSEILKKILTTDDIYMLWAKPLLNAQHSEQDIIKRIKSLHIKSLEKRIAERT